MKAKKMILSFVSKHKSRIVFWGFVLIVFSMVFKGVMQMPQIRANRLRAENLRKQISYEETRQLEIDELSEKVNTDEYIEKVAREKLGLEKNNSKIFVDVSAED